MDYVEMLLEELDGKIVITSDHGNYLGENGVAGHPKYEYTKELREVPWLVVDTGSRPDIIEEDPVNETSIDENKIEQRLEDLGYKT